MDNQQAYQKVKDRLSCRWWRLNNLYYIKDKKGHKVKFKLNWAQKDFYDRLHYISVILKARQLGFTTFAMIYYLDACLFNSNHSAGVIAHTQNDAVDLFDNKIKFAYDNLPEWLKEMRPSTSDSVRKLAFNNQSQIYTGTSLRSGTLQKLLVSEYGKIAAKYPDKAREIKTGALNTLEAGQQVIIESTAEGKTGEYHELVEKARKLSDSGKKLARMEPKFFFYAWWMNPEYVANEQEIEATVIDSERKKYFNDLSLEDIELTIAQKVWYVLKSDQQGDEMPQEFPSTPDEAFQGSMKGAWYTKEMKTIRARGQITSVPYNPKKQVYTWWDLGLNDQMSVWFYQFDNNRHNFIDYHESQLEGWDYYAKMLQTRGYNYAQHGFPHDGNKRVRGAQVFTDMHLAQECGVRPVTITPRTSSVYGDIMNHCIPVLPNCWFDAEKCSVGINHLDNYRKKWSKADSMFTKESLHDEASHCADAFRTFAVNADNLIKGTTKKDDPFASNHNRGGWMS